MRRVECVAGLAALAVGAVCAGELARMPCNNPGSTVDLGVGLWAWPLPMDIDGDLDLVVVCPDKPYNGVYVFEKIGGAEDGHFYFLRNPRSANGR